MARAHRHYIPGQIWHITHRCHKREFLLKYIKDRHRWLQWLFKAKKRYGLVAGFDDFPLFQNAHRQWVDTALEQKTSLSRHTHWSRSIAVGGESFVTEVKRKMRAMSVGRRIRPSKDGFELRESIDPYNAHFGSKKCDIEAENTWKWDLNR